MWPHIYAVYHIYIYVHIYKCINKDANVNSRKTIYNTNNTDTITNTAMEQKAKTISRTHKHLNTIETQQQQQQHVTRHLTIKHDCTKRVTQRAPRSTIAIIITL